MIQRLSCHKCKTIIEMRFIQSMAIKAKKDSYLILYWRMCRVFSDFLRCCHMVSTGIISRCLKIIEKVLFNIASDASYVYILIGQKLTENTKKTNMVSFWKSKAFDQTVLPDRSLSIGQTLVIGGKCYFRTEMRHFSWFINTVQEDFSIENIVNFFSIFLVKFKFWLNSRFLDLKSQLPY